MARREIEHGSTRILGRPPGYLRVDGLWMGTRQDEGESDGQIFAEKVWGR
jgi:hypothetical protein